MIFVLDNYDSFTYNLVQRLGEIDAGLDIRVARNDQITLDEIEQLAPERIIISPGPCTPNEAGISKQVIARFGSRVPVLGVCLGHQCIGEAYQGKVIAAPRLMHGKVSSVHHDGKGLFAGLRNPFTATRYHSLAIPLDSVPADLELCAWTADSDFPREVMGVRHKRFPVHGVQFHPESFLTDGGIDSLKNFLRLRIDGMLTVPEALDAILREVQPAAPVSVALADSLGLVTAEDVRSDVDSPPFDKALMDGFAVRSADLTKDETRLQVIEHVIAGQIPTKPVTAGTTTRIMTGAPLPQGADCVIKVEDARFEPAPSVGETATVVVGGSASAGQHIVRRGASLKVGQSVLPAARLIRPQELGALAEVGKEQLLVHPRPRVGILATGDELVPIGARPGPGQIRNSNEAMLAAQTRRAGAISVPQGIARDDRAALRERIVAGLENEMLLLSGGVSEGTHDLVPSVLAELGVKQVFHKVHIRPGKPLWFGVWTGSGSRGTPRTTYVFGLPGNPVSSLVCFEIFVRPGLRRLMGRQPAVLQTVRARLSQEHVARGDRPTYNPARLVWDDEGPNVATVRWHGSSDLQAMVGANALVLIPGGEATYAPGFLIDVIPFESEAWLLD